MRRWGPAMAFWSAAAAAGCAADYSLDGKWDEDALSPTPSPTLSLTPTPVESGTPTPAPGSGVFFFSDFEDNDGGLVVLDGGGKANPTWEWGAGNPASSGTRFWDTNLNGEYGDTERSCLALAITVTAGSFWRSNVRWDVEEGFDDLRVRVCPPGAPVTGSNTGCDTLQTETGTSTGYETLSFDLAPYAGTQRELRWCLFADSSIEEPGISVDDVAVATQAGLATLP